MAILSREELQSKLQERFGESENDEDISFVEDITDTFNNFDTNDQSARISELETELAEQKKKYRDRFFSNNSDSQESQEDFKDEEEKKTPLRFEELFTEVK